MTSLNDAKVCCACGGLLSHTSIGNHCPRCLLSLGFTHARREPSATPRSFAGYELLEQVGRGGMGVVYRARQVSTGQIVALKMLLDSQQDSPVAVRRFQIEAETIARLTHESILTIYEVGEYEGQSFFSMAFVHGATLQQCVDEGKYWETAEHSDAGRMRQSEIVTLLLKITRAVEYAHGKGVLHRDLKPANILIDERGAPYLTDFGLAKLTDSDMRLSQTDAPMGTPTHMSPEQVRGERLTLASDVYSLGVILYELLTGRPPFQAQTRLELAEEIQKREPTPPRKINPAVHRDLQSICLKCLDKDPNRRYASAGLLAEDLERWQRGERILGRAASSLQKAIRWTRNNKIATALFASLLLTLLASLGLLKIYQQRQAALQEAARVNQLSAVATEQIMQLTGIHTFWKDPSDAGRIIPSDLLAFAARIGRIDPPGVPKERFHVGMLIEEKDAPGSLASYAHLIQYLERSISTEKKITRLDLRVYKRKKSAIEALGNGDIDFLKIGAASFAVANERYPGVAALVAQHPVKNGAIFVRRSSGISELSQLEGKKVALGSVNSTVAMWAIYHFSKLNIAPDFVRMRENSRQAGALPPVNRVERRSKNINEEPIRAVLSAECEAGVINEKVLKDGHHEQLSTVDTFPSSPILWLARRELPEGLKASIANAMTALKDPAMFNALTDRVKSYRAVTQKDLDEIFAMARKVEEITGEPPSLED